MIPRGPRKKLTINDYVMRYVRADDGPISWTIAHVPKSFDHMRLLAFLHILGMR